MLQYQMTAIEDSRLDGTHSPVRSIKAHLLMRPGNHYAGKLHKNWEAREDKRMARGSQLPFVAEMRWTWDMGGQR